MKSTPDDSGDDVERLRFSCMHCGQQLSVTVEQAGVVGPCPRCGASIAAPSVMVADDSRRSVHKDLKIPVKGSVRPAFSHKNGLVMADASVDRGDLAMRELKRMLWIGACFILVFCLCVGAYWFLQSKLQE